MQKKGEIEKWLNSVPSIDDKSLSFGKEEDWFTLYQAWAGRHRNLWHHVLVFIKKVPLSLGNWTVSWVDFGSWLLVVLELLGLIQVVVIFFLFLTATRHSSNYMYCKSPKNLSNFDYNYRLIYVLLCYCVDPVGYFPKFQIYKVW